MIYHHVLISSNVKNVALEEAGNKKLFFCVDSVRLTQKQILNELAKKFKIELAHDYSFESLFHPMNLILTTNIVFSRSINFEFVLKSKKNQNTSYTSSHSDPNLKESIVSSSEKMLESGKNQEVEVPNKNSLILK